MKKTNPQMAVRQGINSGSQKSAVQGIAPGQGNSGKLTPPGKAAQATPQPNSTKTKKQRNWPFVEVIVVLLLFKIGIGAYYISSGSSPELATEADMFSALATETETANSGQVVPSRLDEYLAAVAPAVAHAATQPVSYSAVSAGAMMVMASQNAAPPTATTSAIPLPPGAGDLWKPAAQLPGVPLSKVGATPAQGGAVNSAQLRTREQELARREELLTTKEKALVSLETGLNQRLAAIESSQRELETLTRRNEAILTEQKALLAQQETEDAILRKARMAHLVTAYGGMKPEQAASLVNNLDEDVAVAILAAMPGRKTGLVLAWVDPLKAARLTKAISEQRIDPNQILAAQPTGM